MLDAARVWARAAIGRLEATRAAALARRYLPGGAVTLSALAFAGYAMGLGRDKALAHTFGAGAELDAYNAAFVLPELALDVLVAGGLVAPFVPLFLGLRDEAAAEADRFARTVLGLACGAMTAASVVLFVFAPATVAWIVPGFTPSQQELYIGLFRVMCLTPPIFAASLVVGEVLVAQRRFLWYGLAPLMYSGGIAFGALFLSGALGIYGAAWGAVAGAVGHLAARLVGLRGTGFRPVPGFARRTRGLGEFLRLMLPKMASQPLDPLVFLFYTSLASGLEVGSVSSMNYARNFYGVPVSLIGMSFAIAAFPAMSEAVNAGDRAAFARSFRRTLISIVALSAVAGAALFVVSGLMIGTLLKGGAFDAGDVARTALVLSVFAFAVPLESVMNLLARAVYATRNTLLPTLAALTGFTVLVVTAQAWLPTLGIAAIPASYAVGMGVRTALLAVVLASRTAGIGKRVVVMGGLVAGVGVRTADDSGPAAGGGAPDGVPVAAIVAPAPATGAGRQLRGAPSTSSARRARLPAMRRLALALVTVLVLAVTAVATGQALSSASLVQAPVVTPWAREFALASHDVPALPSLPAAALSESIPTDAPAGSSAAPSAPPSSAQPTPTASPSPTPPLKPFAMDLYQKGDFVGEYLDVWCVPAAIQTSINIMSAGADTSKAYQAKLFNLAYSLAPGNTGGADMSAWPMTLSQLGYGKYKLDTRRTIAAAVTAVAKAIRLTNRPAGLIVWYGWHSWVVSGFRATADPALTNSYTVTGLHIEDVWYNRLSSIWGWSRPPDAFVPVGALPKDYKPYHEWAADPTRDGKFLVVLPMP